MPKRERSVKAKYDKAQKLVNDARTILMCQKIMELKFTETMTVEINKFLTESESL